MSKKPSSTPSKRASAKKAAPRTPATPKKPKPPETPQEPATELRRVGKKGWMQVPVSGE